MSWIGSCPRRWPEVISVLQGAIRERAAAFGIENLPAISGMQSSAVPTTVLKSRVLEIRDAVIGLVEYSLDPRRLGQWGTTMPFSPFLSNKGTLFSSLALDLGDFLCERLRPVSNWKFAECCYELLNGIALYRSPQFSFYATSGHLGLEGTEHYRSLEPDASADDDYDRLFSNGGDGTYLARWRQNRDRSWCDQLHFYNNNSPVTITGNWKSRCSGSVVHRSDLDDHVALYSWEQTEISWNGGTSATLSLPIPDALISQVLYEHDGNESREELLLTFDLPNEIFLTADNLPQLHYTYKD